MLAQVQPCSGARGRRVRDPVNPARTLTAASCRVTPLQPIAHNRRLACSAGKARRGSQAMKSGASAAALRQEARERVVVK